MLPSLPILTPANFAAPSAMGFADASGALNLVSAGSPLPVTVSGGATPTPLTGTMASSGLAVPFVPARGVPVVLTLRGTWQGSVRVYRSTDGGVTLDPLTVGGAPWALFTGNVCEAIWEENDPAAGLHLGVTLSSGVVDFRLGH